MLNYGKMIKRQNRKKIKGTRGIFKPKKFKAIRNVLSEV